jgi:hypothetical protein
MIHALIFIALVFIILRGLARQDKKAKSEAALIARDKQRRHAAKMKRLRAKEEELTRR